MRLQAAVKYLENNMTESAAGDWKTWRSIRLWLAKFETLDLSPYLAVMAGNDHNVPRQLFLRPQKLCSHCVFVAELL